MTAYKTHTLSANGQDNRLQTPYEKELQEIVAQKKDKRKRLLDEIRRRRAERYARLREKLKQFTKGEK